MSVDPGCVPFRRELERALRGTPAGTARSAAELGWHRHLLACEDCRGLLAAEQALEELLRSLPAPRLPRDLARRVLARLEDERRREPRTGPVAASGGLDRLLELDPAPEVPAGLSTRVLGGLAEARAGISDPGEKDLDALLERLPDPRIPEGLSARLLSALEPERKRARFTRLAGRRLAAAAALLLALGWIWRAAVSGAPDDAAPETESVASIERAEGASGDAAGLDVDEELLLNLDVLENWELVNSDDLDLLLAEPGRRRTGRSSSSTSTTTKERAMTRNAPTPRRWTIKAEVARFLPALVAARRRCRRRRSRASQPERSRPGSWRSEVRQPRGRTVRARN